MAEPKRKPYVFMEEEDTCTTLADCSLGLITEAEEKEAGDDDLHFPDIELSYDLTKVLKVLLAIALEPEPRPLDPELREQFLKIQAAIAAAPKNANTADDDEESDEEDDE